MLPTFRFVLTDISRQDDQTLRAWIATDLGKLVALCLKYATYEPDLGTRMPQ